MHGGAHLPPHEGLLPARLCNTPHSLQRIEQDELVQNLCVSLAGLNTTCNLKLFKWQCFRLHAFLIFN